MRRGEIAGLRSRVYWSIAFIVLVQLNYAIAPRFWRRAGS
jgi:hypothetical protein